MADKQFVTGMRVFKPKDTAPEFVKGQLVLNANEIIPWIEANASGDGSIRIDIKEGRSGNWYCEKNTYVKGTEAKPKDTTLDDIF